MAVVCTTRRVDGILSIQGGGPLSSDLNLQLVGDVNQPGTLYYYGTNNQGQKGWHALPTNISNLVNLEARVAVLESKVAALEITVADHETRILDL